MKRFRCIPSWTFVSLVVYELFLTIKDTKAHEGSTEFRPVHVQSKPCVRRGADGLRIWYVECFSTFVRT